jgi:hypothetical protein
MVKIDRESSDGLKLAYLFWSSIDRPKAFAGLGFLEAWAPRMEKLMHRVSLPYSEFRWFIIWSTRLPDEDGTAYGNTFTAQNLRVARNPMGSLEKQFSTTYYDIFLPRAAKRISLLRDRVQREIDERSRNKTAQAPRLTWYDVIVRNEENPSAWKVEKARWSTTMDECFPMLEPAPGESMDDFVHRMFLPFSANREWRCSRCEYGVGEDGDMDERVRWCEDCADELRINMADDMELLEEIPVVSDITREWE